MNKVELINTDWAVVFSALDDESVDLIYTDPPYGMGYVSNIPGSKHWNKSGVTASKFDAPMPGDDDSIDWSRFVAEAYRVLKMNRFMALHVNIPFLMKRGTVFTDSGFTYKGTIAWDKSFAIGGDLKGSMKRDWEPILYLAKGKPTLNPLTVERGKKKVRVLRRRISEINDWRFTLKDSEKCGHPTQKPLALARQVIRLMSKEDDLVLDPFAGSGTFALACQTLGRANISVEVDKKAFNILQKRIAV